MQVRRGDVRVARPPDGAGGTPRAVAVLAVGPLPAMVEVALVHTSRELATSADVIVDGAAAGTSYPLVVQTDLRGVVFTGQLGGCVGRLPADVLDGGGERGVRMMGEWDRRWKFKCDEGRDLDALTGTATRVALGTLDTRIR